MPSVSVLAQFRISILAEKLRDLQTESGVDTNSPTEVSFRHLATMTW
ncbi:MAG: hypothetical protein AB7F64_02745 [Gammaproteobacteria bacterium]